MGTASSLSLDQVLESRTFGKEPPEHETVEPDKSGDELKTSLDPDVKKKIEVRH